jgi:hypothetical protein
MTLESGAAFAVALAAYVANTVVGGLAKVDFSGANGATLRSIHITDHAAQNEPYRIHIYDSLPTTTIADADAFAPVDADGDAEIGEVLLVGGDYATANGSAYSKAHLRNLNIDIPESAGGVIRVYLQCTDTPDYVAVGNLVLDFVFWIE